MNQYKHNPNEPSANAKVEVWQAYLQQFSKKKITKKFAGEAKEKRLNPKKEAKPFRHCYAIKNADLEKNARTIAHDSNRRLSNWNWPEPKVNCKDGDFLMTNHGRYSSRCTYNRYSYTPIYKSYVKLPIAQNIVRGARGFLYVTQGKKRFVRAPKGMVFKRDKNGLFLFRLSDKMDLHFTGSDLFRSNFATWVRAEMAANFKRRQEVKREEKRKEKEKVEASRLEKIFLKNLETTRVTLQDSRNAGNCIEGSLAFMERRFKIDRAEILRGPFIFSGKKLWESGDRQAMAAVRKAYERETAVSI